MKEKLKTVRRNITIPEWLDKMATAAKKCLKIAKGRNATLRQKPRSFFDMTIIFI